MGSALKLEHDTLSSILTRKKTHARLDDLGQENYYYAYQKENNQIDNEPLILNRFAWLVLISFVIVSHFFGVKGLLSALHTPSILNKKDNEVLVEFIKPETPPPPKVEEPPPPPPPPKIEQPKRITPQPTRTVTPMHTQVAEDDIKPTDLTVKENTEAPKTTGPVVAEAPPPPPPTPVVQEEPLTEASGSADYLKNPQPEYPDFALRQGWEGTVLLRVRVLASGKAQDVQVKKSSGRKLLDEAAQEVVQSWTFVPAKKGKTPVDSWTTVPIVFKITR